MVNTIKQSTLDQLTCKNRVPEISLHIRHFLLHCKHLGRSPKTTSFYQMHLSKFAWWCEQNGLDEPNQITVRQLEEFAGYLRENDHRWDCKHPRANVKLSQASIAAYFRAVKAFIRWLHREGEYMKIDPFKLMEMPKNPDKVIATLTIEHVRSMLKVVGENKRNQRRNQAMILLLLDTGIRAAELCSLKLQDVTDDTIKVLGKGNKERIMPVGPKTARALWLYVQKERPESRLPYVFLTEDATQMTIWRLRFIVNDLGEKAGITGVRVSPHTFRHTFAVSCLRSKEWDLLTLKHAMGHTRTTTTEVYLKTIGDQDVGERHRRYSPAEALSVAVR